MAFNTGSHETRAQDSKLSGCAAGNAFPLHSVYGLTAEPPDHEAIRWTGIYELGGPWVTVVFDATGAGVNLESVRAMPRATGLGEPCIAISSSETTGASCHKTKLTYTTAPIVAALTN